MSFNHEAVAALPVLTAADKALIRAMSTRRFVYVLTAAESSLNFVAVDPDTGVIPLVLFQGGSLFAYDSADSTTTHDGITCLVSSDGKRFKTTDFTAFVALLTKTDVGLGNVDNTSDVNKPVSTAQATALNAKANLGGGNSFTGAQTVNGAITVTGSAGATAGSMWTQAGYGTIFAAGRASPASYQYAFFDSTISTIFGGFNAAGNWQVGAGIISISPTAGVGYGPSAGGTATQATSKATGVTLHKVTGLITMNAAALAAGTIVSFALTDSAIAATDQIIVSHESGGTAGAYTVNGRATGAGTGAIDVRNNTAGSLSEAIVLRFSIIKSVNA
jgi:hypothetical protein